MFKSVVAHDLTVFVSVNAFRGLSGQNSAFSDGDPVAGILSKLFSVYLQKYLQEGVFLQKFS